jgi:glyoxylase-like metal-dependent hydrolase (beta-lactamase superfamily II)/rhodanese-related sulfurtransferase
MDTAPHITNEMLGQMLSSGEPVNIIDIRPLHERSEWFIPGSIYIDAYDRLKQNDPSLLKNVHLDKSVPVVTVCAGGKMSQVAADFFLQNGYKAYSLKDGMKGWGLAWNIAYHQFEDFEIWQVRRTGKGCLSYIIASDQEAVIIDASLPVEIYINLINENHLVVRQVLETHIHADHLSRSKQLADELSVDLMLPVPNKVTFAFKRLENNHVIKIGKISARVLATPGHTLESVCFIINNNVLISGDTIFTNAVGRPDLKANEEEVAKRAELLYYSLQRVMELDDNIIVLPAHTNKPVDFDGRLVAASIGEIKSKVPVLSLSKTEFVENILSKLPPAPGNYLKIIERNLSGNMSGINPLELETGANRCAVS